MARGWAGGRTLEASLEQARGAPDHPLSDRELTDKFVDCASRAAQPMGAETARAMAGQILSLEDCPDVGDLFATA